MLNADRIDGIGNPCDSGLDYPLCLYPRNYKAIGAGADLQLPAVGLLLELYQPDIFEARSTGAPICG